MLVQRKTAVFSGYLSKSIDLTVFFTYFATKTCVKSSEKHAFFMKKVTFFAFFVFFCPPRSSWFLTRGFFVFFKARRKRGCVGSFWCFVLKIVVFPASFRILKFLNYVFWVDLALFMCHFLGFFLVHLLTFCSEYLSKSIDLPFFKGGFYSRPERPLSSVLLKSFWVLPFSEVKLKHRYCLVDSS